MDLPPERSDCCEFGNDHDDIYSDNIMSRFIQDMSKALPSVPLVNENNNAEKESDGNANGNDSSSSVTIDKRRDLIVNPNDRDCSKKFGGRGGDVKHGFVLISDNARVINKFRPKQYQCLRIVPPLSLHSSLFSLKSNNSKNKNIDRWGTNCSTNIYDNSPTIVTRRLFNRSRHFHNHSNNKSDTSISMLRGMISIDSSLTIPNRKNSIEAKCSNLLVEEHNRDIDNNKHNKHDKKNQYNKKSSTSSSSSSSSTTTNGLIAATTTTDSRIL